MRSDTLSRTLSTGLALFFVVVTIFFGLKSLSPDAALPWDVIGTLGAWSLAGFFAWLALPMNKKISDESEEKR